MKWWKDAKFGIFIHFGPYAVPAGTYQGNARDFSSEWLMYKAHVPSMEYRKYCKELTLNKFNPRTWAKAFKAAGAKYVVVTTKHHDGFCMFDTKESDYNIVKATPYGKDFMKELANACRAEGLIFCTYYSILEWDNPALGTRPHQNKPAYIAYMKKQLAEIIKQYNPKVIWFDGEYQQGWTQKDGEDMYRYLRTLNPKIIINDRLTQGRQQAKKTKKVRTELNYSDFCSPEQEVPETGLPVSYWETCMTMNKSWGYHKTDHKWKSPEQLVNLIRATTSKGGNFLLNVGPKPDGTIPQESLDRLKYIGDALKKNPL